MVVSGLTDVAGESAWELTRGNRFANANDHSVCFRTSMSSSMKRTASDIDADGGKPPSKRLKTEAGPKPVSNESVGIKREGSSAREVEETGKPSRKLAYPSKNPPSGRDGPPVPFQQPTSLTTFSYNSKRELRFDDSAMRYYVDPPHGADLHYGYERWVKRPEEKGRLDGLLKAWLKVRNGFPDGTMHGGVIAWRGVMTRYVNGP